MNELTVHSLPMMVKAAANRLASAGSAAEVLEARDMASVAYDMAKKASRLQKAKAAHDEIIVKTAHAQADALDIEARAKRRLADEYDAAQDRGEVGQSGARTDLVPNGNEVVPSASDIFGEGGRKAIHDARIIRDAEQNDPGIVRRALDTLLANGEEPTRAALSRELSPQSRKPLVSDAALWLWGRLRDFERNGYFDADPHALLTQMTEPMRDDVRHVVPRVREFLETLEVAVNERP